MFLIGDIGGTKVHLALVEDGRFVKEEKFPSRHFDSLSEVMGKFLDKPVEKACFTIAGPVSGRQCKMTNLHWEIDAAELEKTHRIGKVVLLNDLEASGWGIKRLKPADLVTLNKGVKQDGNQVVVAAGTGFGVAGLYWDGKRHHPFATEGGHSDFGFQTDLPFCEYLRKKYGHVSVERVVSGPGLEHLYWFLVETGKHKNIFEGEEIPRLIVEQGLSGKSPLCQEALGQFAAFYGAAAGNAALQYLSRGGIYLAGGLAPRIVKVLQQGEFMRAFSAKGRFQELLLQMPVHIVLNEALPLLGALECCNF
jgi:glucokinase